MIQTPIYSKEKSRNRNSIIETLCVENQSVCVHCVLVAQSCLILCDPTDCGQLGFSVYGILQARILEWIDIPFSREASQPRDQTLVSCIAGRFFTIWATKEVLKIKGPHRIRNIMFPLFIKKGYVIQFIKMNYKMPSRSWGWWLAFLTGKLFLYLYYGVKVIFHLEDFVILHWSRDCYLFSKLSMQIMIKFHTI